MEFLIYIPIFVSSFLIYHFIYNKISQRVMLIVERYSDKFKEIYLFLNRRVLLIIIVGVPAILSLLALLATGSIFLSLFILFFSILIPKYFFLILRKRRLKELERQFPSVLISLSNSLRSGLSLTQAIEIISRYERPPVSQEFSLILKEQRIGIPFDQSLHNFYQRNPIDDIQLFVISSITARATGGNLSEIYERLSHTIDEKHRIEGKIKSLTAQGKLQGIVVSLIPPFFLFVLSMIDFELVYPLFSENTGRIILIAVIVLEIIGSVLIRKIVNIKV